MAKQKKKKELSKGRDISISEKITIAQQVCELYSTDQYTLTVCLANFGIESDSTWYKWCHEIEEIEEAYNKAKEIKRTKYQGKLREKARTTLERYLDGFTVDIVEQIGTAKLGQNGEQVIEIDKVKNKQIYIRPSVTAALKVLYNVDGRNFTPNPEPYKAGNENIPQKVEIEIKGEMMPPLTSEDEIKDDDL